MTIEPVTLTANGLVYEGWTAMRVTRNLEHMASDFTLEVSERWAGQKKPWQIPPFTPCVIALGGDTVLTGYSDDYNPDLDGQSHKVEITGRSKTCDIVDCMPPIGGGQFIGSSLSAIAKAVAGYFGIAVVFDADVSTPMPEATYELTETAFAYLDRLCRLSGVLALDDENGNLVIAQAGTASAQGALVEGRGARWRAKLSAKQRFSHYVVLAQAPLAYDGEQAQIAVLGTASDPAVPRFRRFAENAESAADDGLAQARAKWRAQRNAGRGLRLTVTVPGWRQTSAAGAPLWAINQLVPVKNQKLWLDRTLLVVGVTFILDNEGARTELELSPQEGYMPDPGSVKSNLVTTDAFWNGAAGIAGGPGQ